LCIFAAVANEEKASLPPPREAAGTLSVILGQCVQQRNKTDKKKISNLKTEKIVSLQKLY
jgi:hypothetical protein